MTIYEIAYHLRMPVYKLSNEMPYTEFLDWLEYFDRRPVEWRSDSRAYKLMQAQGVKEKPENLFESLRALHRPKDIPEGETDMSTLKHSVLFQKMMQAVNGDQIDVG
jgi:hypothetical protein